MKTDITIEDIEAITENCIISEDKVQIKGYNVYFVDFGGYFGFSALVFKNGRQIIYANDYQLHHEGMSPEELRGYYINSLKHKLFTEEEIKAPLKDYSDYKIKDWFLKNCYIYQYEFVSIYDEKNIDTTGWTDDTLSLGYVRDADIVTKHIKLFNILEQNKKELFKNPEQLQAAFLDEMYNHEYAYNWQGDYDVLSVFGILRYSEEYTAVEYLEQLNIKDEYATAYFKALKQYNAKQEF